MKNSRAKGTRTFNKVKAYLQSQGYRVANVERTSRHIKEKDAFGILDGIAIKGKTWIMFQSTTNRPHVHYKMQEFANMHGSEHVWINQYVWIDYKGLDEYSYYPSGYKKKERVK